MSRRSRDNSKDNKSKTTEEGKFLNEDSLTDQSIGTALMYSNDEIFQTSNIHNDQVLSEAD